MTYRLGVLILALIVAAYWAQVVKMTRRARRRSGRAANFLPPETLGWALRLVWVPIVVIWIGHPFVTVFARPHWRLIDPLLARGWIACASAVIAAVCLYLSRGCWKAMGKSWRMGIDPSERTALVFSGPYAYVRHPIYALSQAMMLATVVAIPSPLMIAAGLVHVALLQWEARREEAYLARVHGQEYAGYCTKVRRFVPAVGWVISRGPSRRGGPQ